MGCACVRGLAVTLFTIGILCLAATKYAPQFVASKLDTGIKQQLVWAEDSPDDVDGRYRNSTTGPPDLVRFYLLNVTNPDEVRNGTAKPNLVELGPYTYRTYRIKLDVWWNRGGEVSFKGWQYYVEEPDLTVGSLDDNITLLNLPLIGVLETITAAVDSPMTRFWLGILAQTVERFNNTNVRGVFTTRTVRELLWGFEDKLLVTLKRLLPKMVDQTVFSLVQNVSSLEEAMQLPTTVVDTGIKDMTQLWNMHQVDGYREVRSWNGCVEAVRGSDAQQFPPNLTEDSTLWVWVSELFRAARMVVTEVVELYGIRLLRFRPDPAQGDPDPCHFQTINGLMNVTSPRAAGPAGPSGKPGPPLYISMPHFCQADPDLLEGVVGLQCDKSKHLTYVDVEPITGSTMRAFKRLMLSSQPSASATAVDAKIDPSVIIPMFWAEESSQLEPAEADSFKASVYRAQKAIHQLNIYPYYAAIGFVTAALLLIILSILPTRRHLHKPPPPSAVDRDSPSSSHTAPAQADLSHSADEFTALTEPLLPAADSANQPSAVDSAPTQPAVGMDTSEATTSAVHPHSTSAVHPQSTSAVHPHSTSAEHPQSAFAVHAQSTSAEHPHSTAHAQPRVAVQSTATPSISHYVSVSLSSADEASGSVPSLAGVLWKVPVEEGAGVDEGGERDSHEGHVVVDVQHSRDQQQGVNGADGSAPTAGQDSNLRGGAGSGLPGTCSTLTSAFASAPAKAVVNCPSDSTSLSPANMDGTLGTPPNDVQSNMPRPEQTSEREATEDGHADSYSYPSSFTSRTSQGRDIFKRKSELPAVIAQLLESHHIDFE